MTKNAGQLTEATGVGLTTTGNMLGVTADGVKITGAGLKGLGAGLKSLASSLLGGLYTAPASAPIGAGGVSTTTAGVGVDASGNALKTTSTGLAKTGEGVQKVGKITQAVGDGVSTAAAAGQVGVGAAQGDWLTAGLSAVTVTGNVLSGIDNMKEVTAKAGDATKKINEATESVKKSMGLVKDTTPKATTGLKKAVDIAKNTSATLSNGLNMYNTYSTMTILGGGQDDAAETEDATGTTANADASNVDVNANDQKPTKSLDEIFAKYKKG